MKRIFNLITICLLVTILFLNNVYNMKVHAVETKLTIDIGENFSSTDSQVRIPLYIKNLPQNGLSAMNFVIEFDDGLILNDIKAGEILNNSADLSYYVDFNKIHILFSDSTAGTYPIKNEGNLCYLIFSVNTSANKDSFIVKKVTSSDEIFVDNYLNKLQADFIEGKILKKDELYKVQSNKLWRVTFNHEVDPLSVSSNTIQLKDVNGQVISNTCRISSDGKTLEILPPQQGYKINNSYTITMKNSISSKYGRSMLKEENINFYVDR
jgi:hypothetical protein